MKKGSFIVVLLALICMPTVVLAKHNFSIDRLEFGAHAGVGFFVSPREIGNATHVQAYDILYFRANDIDDVKWPGIETFGFSVGYRINSRMLALLQTTRQRLCFIEELPSGERPLYYNAMWHLEGMFEYNFMNLDMEMRPYQGIYNLVPYVGLGYGITMYNQEATLRHDGKNIGTLNTMYPRVGYKAGEGENNKVQYTPDKVGLSMYIPVAVGLKWRINDNVQLKGAFQYQLHFQDPKSGKINSNLSGSTQPIPEDKLPPLYGGIAGNFHNCLFSLGVIFNFGTFEENQTFNFINF